MANVKKMKPHLQVLGNQGIFFHHQEEEKTSYAWVAHQKPFPLYCQERPQKFPSLYGLCSTHRGRDIKEIRRALCFLQEETGVKNRSRMLLS